MGIYVGIKEQVKPEIFEADSTPTKETHPKFDFILGPFKTVDDAQTYVNAMNRGVACGEG